MAKNIVYQEGDVILVPLQDGGYATGLIARTNFKGVAFGYFFAPKINHIPEFTLDLKLQFKDAIFVRKFGDSSIDGNGWPIIGKCRGFSKEIWTLPFFYRRPMDCDFYFVSEYNDKLEYQKQWKADLDDPSIKRMVPDELMGHVLLQAKLTRLIV